MVNISSFKIGLLLDEYSSLIYMWLAYHLFNRLYMEKPTPEHYLLITSWPDLHDARHQVNRWLEKKLAASVNVLPQMDSIVSLEGRITTWHGA